MYSYYLEGGYVGCMGGVGCDVDLVECVEGEDEEEGLITLDHDR